MGSLIRLLNWVKTLFVSRLILRHVCPRPSLALLKDGTNEDGEETGTTTESSEDSDIDGSPFIGPLGNLRKKPIVGRKNMLKIFGHPEPVYRKDKGCWVADPDWERDSMKSARDLPFGIKKMYMNKKVEPYFREALRRTEKRLPLWKPKGIGCFAVRKQRHKDDAPWSDHAFGIAFDFKSDDGSFRRQNAKLPPELILSMKELGFAWGGDWRNKDEMHFSIRF